MFVITGGGTGGHLAIALALAQELQIRSIPCIYIGSTSGQDKMWFENSNLFSQTIFLESTGVVNKRGLSKVAALAKIIKGANFCRKIFKSHKVRAVISVGGFSAASASIAAIASKISLFIHEQNAVSGSLNKLLTPFAKKVFGSFENNARNFMQCDYPVRAEFFENSRVRDSLDSVIFLGGSQGAKAINDFALALAPKLLEMGIKISHQCGERDYSRVKDEYEKLGIDVNVFAFSKNLVHILKDSDVCIGRAGAGSVWENAANGLPCFFVPYPYAAKNHQFFNAQYFVEKNLGGMCLESELDSQKVLEFLQNLKIRETSKALLQTISQNGAKNIINTILKLQKD